MLYGGLTKPCERCGGGSEEVEEGPEVAKMSCKQKSVRDDCQVDFYYVIQLLYYMVADFTRTLLYIEEMFFNRFQRTTNQCQSGKRDLRHLEGPEQVSNESKNRLRRNVKALSFIPGFSGDWTFSLPRGQSGVFL